MNRRSPPVLLILFNSKPSMPKAYILGDFFNYWVGDDDNNPLHQQVANELKQLTDRGIPCYFIHGNRDF